MANDKTPGLDGLTTNFYKFFWPDIKDILFDSYISSFEHGELSSGQRIGVLSLIPKKTKISDILNLGDQSFFWQQTIQY